MRVFLAFLVVLAVLAVLASARRETFSTDAEFECFVINMARNPDRMKSVSEMHAKGDLPPLQRFEGVDGDKIEDMASLVTPRVLEGLRFIEETGTRKNGRQLTKGMIGAYRSHRGVHEAIRRGGKPFGLVFEDDVSFEADLGARIRRVLGEVPGDWDIILLGRIQHEVVQKGTYLEVRDFWGLWGYLISQTGITKMQKFADGPIDEQIDIVMSQLARAGSLNVYAPLENEVATGDFGTTIQMSLTDQV